MKEIKQVSAHQLNEWMKNSEKVQLIDVRSSGEYAAGHIPSSMNLPLEQVTSRVEDVCSKGHVVLICKSGRRACIAHNDLLPSCANLAVLEGGIESWSKSQLPIVLAQKSKWSLERQVRLIVGVLILISVVLALTVSVNWLVLTVILGVGLTFAGLTDICGLGLLLSKLPWNRSNLGKTSQISLKNS